VLRASAAAEAAGIPTVAIVSDAFIGMARVIAASLGIPDVPLAVYPGVIATDPEPVFVAKLEDSVIPAIVEGLTLGGSRSDLSDRPEAADVAEWDARDIVFVGSYDEVSAFYVARSWTDGLPVVPPTLDRVDRAMGFTDRPADEVIGIDAPAYQ